MCQGMTPDISQVFTGKPCGRVVNGFLVGRSNTPLHEHYRQKPRSQNPSCFPGKNTQGFPFFGKFSVYTGFRIPTERGQGEYAGGLRRPVGR